MNIEAGKEMLFLTHWPNGELLKVMILGENEFMPGSYRFKKPDGRTDFTKPDFLFDLPVASVSTDIEKAEQQFTGFKIGKDSGDVVDLIQSMGLSLTEWQELLKGHGRVDIRVLLNDDDIDSINDYFNVKR